MLILGIETSGETGSVALCRGAEVLASYSFPEGARHARNLMPAIARVVDEGGARRSEVQAVAVSRGPGSFTGLRVGVTCAKTLAWSLGWQVVGVPSLEVQVQNVAPRPGLLACPTLDARRDRVYGTLFRWDGGRWQDTTGVLILEPQDLASALPDGALLFGAGVAAYPDVFACGRFELGDPALGMGRAEQAARLGLRLLAEGQRDDPMSLVARYYRPTQAEEKVRSDRGT